MNILITGSSSGLGKALAQQYACKANTLVLLGRNQERLAAVKKHCEQKDATVFSIIVDITDPAYQQKVTEISKAHDFDLVFANAGIHLLERFETNSMEKFADVENIINTNFLAQLKTIFPLRDGLQRRKGRVVIISSLNALFGVPQDPAYCAAKAALTRFFEGLRPTLRQQGVLTTLVFPGFIETSMSEKVNTPKPFCLSADKAAKRIQHGIQKNKSVIVFPKRLRLLMSLRHLIPIKWLDRIINQY